MQMEVMTQPNKRIFTYTMVEKGFLLPGIHLSHKVGVDKFLILSVF